VGWQPQVFDNAVAGTTGQGLRLEALKVNINSAQFPGASVCYQAHVQNIGWQPEVCDGGLAGTTGRSLRLEALKIHLVNAAQYRVCYQAHVQNIGWQPEVCDGAVAGTTGQSLRIEAVRIRILPAVGTGPGGVGGAGHAYAWEAASSPTARFITVHVHTNPIDGHTAWWMDTTATLDRTTGIVTWKNHTESDNWCAGFTGGVNIQGGDDQGNLIASAGTVVTAGVDGSQWWCGGGANSQDRAGTTQMTGDYRDVTELTVINWHDAHNRLNQDLATVKSAVDVSSTAAGLIKTIIALL
jgi:hypothetical protein